MYQVERDPQYTGKVINEKATVIMRLAPTFLRFGSFEIFKPRYASINSTASHCTWHSRQFEHVCRAMP